MPRCAFGRCHRSNAAKAKFGGWAAIHDFDVICTAHLHHPNYSTYLDKDHMLNASFVGIDDLSERMATFSRPSQKFFGIDAEVGVSFHYNVYVETGEVVRGDEHAAVMRKVLPFLAPSAPQGAHSIGPV